ncbi:TPA: acyltransferase, partial [Escherichia coli]|nr:acyltransferase [Escherichia coli]
MFFIISGYIISLSTEKKDNSIVKGYIIKRFFRIYPAYFIALSILIILSPIKYSHHDILRS